MRIIVYLLCLYSILPIQKADQYLLFDAKNKRVGDLSFVDKCAYLRVTGSETETLNVIFVTRRGERTFYQVENELAKGYILIDQSLIICDFVLSDRQHYYQVFYRKKIVKKD